MSQIRLGELIDLLILIPPRTPIRFQYPFGVPTNFERSRGWPGELSLGFTLKTEKMGNHPLVGHVLQYAKLALGGTFKDVDGNVYVTSRDTPLWIDNPGEWSNRPLWRIEDRREEVVLRTKPEDIDLPF
jgi:hypothetical protein